MTTFFAWTWLITNQFITSVAWYLYHFITNPLIHSLVLSTCTEIISIPPVYKENKKNEDIYSYFWTAFVFLISEKKKKNAKWVLFVNEIIPSSWDIIGSGGPVWKNFPVFPWLLWSSGFHGSIDKPTCIFISYKSNLSPWLTCGLLNCWRKVS